MLQKHVSGGFITLYQMIEIVCIASLLKHHWPKDAIKMLTHALDLLTHKIQCMAILF
jgi:hypothetical protein